MQVKIRSPRVRHKEVCSSILDLPSRDLENQRHLATLNRARNRFIVIDTYEKLTLSIYSKDRLRLRQTLEQLQQFGIVRCSQSSTWIPTLYCGKPSTPTIRIVAFRDIVQCPRILVQYWVHETHWAFTDFCSLFVYLDSVSIPEKTACPALVWETRTRLITLAKVGAASEVPNQ